MIPAFSLERHMGLSKPRASGDDPKRIMTGTDEGDVNPARAGMIPTVTAVPAATASKPRASGDDPREEARRGRCAP